MMISQRKKHKNSTADSGGTISAPIGKQKMEDGIAGIIERIRALDDELEAALAHSRAQLNYRFEQGKIVFERDIQRQHAALRQKLLPYIAGAKPLVALTAPVIYAMIIPFIILDVFVTLYQMICFPVYRIKKVSRADHIVFDRKHLSYLNGLEKLNCLYCSYGNGLLSYASEIAGLTEKHWCPIKHAKRMESAHRYYPEFLEFGDAEGYRQQKRSPVQPQKP